MSHSRNEVQVSSNQDSVLVDLELAKLGLMVLLDIVECEWARCLMPAVRLLRVVKGIGRMQYRIDKTSAVRVMG